MKKFKIFKIYFDRTRLSIGYTAIQNPLSCPEYEYTRHEINLFPGVILTFKTTTEYEEIKPKTDCCNEIYRLEPAIDGYVCSKCGGVHQHEFPDSARGKKIGREFVHD
ncbi:MAG: hypothetical protein K8823_1533 [Cenarchaeum symbiont of Oopsacas minuta]|nr:hypothetical protein [Cenarchaeum symbiont of Oopsacas minuta]